jgi:hypothetical protein
MRGTNTPNLRFRERATASYKRWREQRQFRKWGAIGGAIFALFVIGGILVVKYDGSAKLIAKRVEPTIAIQGTPTADPLAPAIIAVPDPRN